MKRFVKRYSAFFEKSDFTRVGVEACDLVPQESKTSPRREADVSGSNDGNFHNLPSYAYSAFERARPSYRTATVRACVNTRFRGARFQRAASSLLDVSISSTRRSPGLSARGKNNRRAEARGYSRGYVILSRARQGAEFTGPTNFFH